MREPTVSACRLPTWLNFELLHAAEDSDAMLRAYGYAVANRSYWDHRKRSTDVNEARETASGCVPKVALQNLQCPTTDTAEDASPHMTATPNSVDDAMSKHSGMREFSCKSPGRNERMGGGRRSPSGYRTGGERGSHRGGGRGQSRRVKGRGVGRGRGKKEHTGLQVRDGVGVSGCGALMRGGEQKELKTRSGEKKGKVGLGGVSTMVEAGRAGKREREREREGLSKGEEQEELCIEETLDSRTQKLGQYLCANLNFEPDSDEGENVDGFMLDGYDIMGGDDDTTDISPLAGVQPSPSYPSYPFTAKSLLTVSEDIGESKICNTEATAGEDVHMRCGSKHSVAVVGESDGQFNDWSDQSEDGASQSDDVVQISGDLGHTLPRGMGMVCGAECDGGSGAGCEGEGRGEELEDDGWVSDSGEAAAFFQVNSVGLEAAALQLPPYAMYEDDIWVDEAKAIFAKHKKENSKELQELLSEMFSLHTDVYSLLLAFVKRAGKTRQPPKSVPRIALAAFQKWLGEGDEREREGGRQEDKTRNPAVLRAEHQENVLELMTRCHLTMVDDLCRVFKLHLVDEDLLIDLVQNLLSENRRKEAVTYAWTFHLQPHFALDEMLLPLIAMDKINLIENYIDEDRELQEQFVMLLDRLCCSGGRPLLTSYIKRFGLDASDPNSKLSSKQLFKMALRLVKMYSLDLNQFPSLSSQRRAVCLHHLIRQRYVERNITDRNMEDLVAAAIRSHPGLEHLLVLELVHKGELHAAAHWAATYHIPLNTLPLGVQYILMCGEKEREKEKERERERSPTEYLQLSLPPDCVHFVDSADTLRNCRHRLSQKGAIIGVDAEWRLPICNDGDERMALMQLAVSDAVYLLDMLALTKLLSESELRDFVRDVFANSSTTKLGYSIEGDLDLLIRSWSFAADILCSPVRVVDIKTLATMVDNLQNQVQPTVPELPPHPLMLQKAGGGSLQPSQPPYTQHQPIPHSHQAKKSNVSDPLTILTLTAPRGSPEEDFYDDPLSLEGSLETGKHKGLSLLVQKELGKPLNKLEQLSDWEKRPLSPEQVRYAALDAVCLLQLYSTLTTQALAIDPLFNTEPTVPPLKISRGLLRKIKEST